MKRNGQGWRCWVVACLVVIGASASFGLKPATASTASQIDGQVVNQQGEPVAGAQVFGAFDLGWEAEELGGEVIPSAVADKDGRFQLTWGELGQGRGEPALWVYREGYRLTRGEVSARDPVQATRVTLLPAVVPAAASVQILGPHGEPVLARIIPTRWFASDLGANSARVWTIPEPVGVLVATQTNGAGRATLTAVAALRLSAVRVESAFGTQLATWDETLTARHRVVKLRPAGRVTGQVKGDDPASGANLKVQVISTVKAQVVGFVELVTDQTGRFDATAVATGHWSRSACSPKSGRCIWRSTFPAELWTRAVLSQPASRSAAEFG